MTTLATALLIIVLLALPPGAGGRGRAENLRESRITEPPSPLPGPLPSLGGSGEGEDNATLRHAKEDSASAYVAANDEYVVLLHGLARSSFSMKGIERYLKARGYHVINARYSTARLSVKELSDTFLDHLIKTEIPDGVRVNFVTHSQGGILVRQYLSDHELPNLGRVVMLAPPNHGSELGDLLRKNPLTHAMLGPGFLELGTDTNSAPNRLGPIDFDCGVIAGDRSFNPLFSALLPGPDDGKVTVASAKMDGLADFLVVHNSHTWMMWRSGTLSQVLSFLESGRFNRVAGAPERAQ